MGIDISLWRGWYCHCFSHTGIPKEFELYFTDYEFSQNHLGWKSPPRTSQARSPPEHWVSHPGRNQQHFLGFLWHEPALCGLPITHCLLFHSSAMALSVLWMLQLFRVQVKQKVLIKSDTAAPCGEKHLRSVEGTVRSCPPVCIPTSACFPTAKWKHLLNFIYF